ncbi:MAG: hypothetical protein HF300_17945 [Ignavibacteria bacterium]|jgi:hypothetical protein|nr:hypothetical protein [Ignavibacteria bacterium]MCU7514447.1 hypothetical protein [Ignavibacteria bacterium]MCU7526246.1 hypothetical protein [Ignavibacteria bacterium]HEX2961701.1 hypothetical protein [Ignavibacteriales bacterium]
MSKLVETDKIQPGMVLETPVVNKYGQMLLSRGAVIESRHIAMLKTWGVSSILIYNDQEENEARAYDPELLNKAKEQLMQRMGWIPRNAVEENMVAAAVELLLK